MANIANLAVQLTAKTGKFTKSMQSAAQSVKSMGANVAKVGALLGTAMAAGVASVVKHNAELIDGLGKMSTMLGETTENLQAFNLANELSGVSQETGAKALKNMVSVISEAAQGTGTAKDAIAELGLSAEELNKMTPVEAFNALSVALAQVENQSDKVRIGFDLFGARGAQIINTMGESGDAVMRAKQELAEFGGALNNIEVRGVEQMNDSLTKLGAMFTTFGQTLTVEIAPAITALVTKGMEFIKAYGGFGKVGREAAIIIVEGALGMVGAVAKVAQVVLQAKSGFLTMGAAALHIIASLQNGFNQLWSGIKMGALFASGLILEAFTFVFDKVSSVFLSMLKSFRGISDTLDEVLNPIVNTLAKSRSTFLTETKVGLANDIQAGIAEARQAFNTDAGASVRAEAKNLDAAAADAFKQSKAAEALGAQVQGSFRESIQEAINSAANSSLRDRTADVRMNGGQGAAGAQEVESEDLSQINKNIGRLVNQGVRVSVG